MTGSEPRRPIDSPDRVILQLATMNAKLDRVVNLRYPMARRTTARPTSRRSHVQVIGAPVYEEMAADPGAPLEADRVKNRGRCTLAIGSKLLALLPCQGRYGAVLPLGGRCVASGCR